MKIHIPSYDERDAIGTEIIIHSWDTWNMDHTLALIILPMLKQLKKTKHGSPNVEDSDVPEELRSTNAAPKENTWDTDELWHQRWDYVLDEMIWTFEQMHIEQGWEDQYYGPYIDGPEGGVKDGHFEWVDHEGLKAHQQRMNTGFQLFGKYYQSLWD